MKNVWIRYVVCTSWMIVWMCSGQTTRSAEAALNMCVQKRTCRTCSQSCLNRARKALRACKIRARVGKRRCLSSVSTQMRSCLAKSRVLCSRTCRTSRSRVCVRRCVIRINRRCNVAHFRAQCHIAYQKERVTCKPRYRKSAKRCCRRGYRICRRKEVCRSVVCVRAHCPKAQTCRCTGRLLCERTCRTTRVRLFRRIRQPRLILRAR